MDTILITLAQDRIRAEINDHGKALHRIEHAMQVIQAASTDHAKALQRVEWKQAQIMRKLKEQGQTSRDIPKETWRQYFKPMITNALMWGAGMLVITYVLNGGDIGKLLGVLLGLGSLGVLQ